jgi:hypothetical protein
MREATDDGNADNVKKSQWDLVVLKHMVQRLRMTLLTLDQSTHRSLPLVYSLEEHHGRTHRLVICEPRALVERRSLSFVGFISSKQTAVEARLSDELHRADQAMLNEITQVPGLLSYSSLELRTDHWYNLVLFLDANVKTSFATLPTHRYAAYELAPLYYAWIRLRHGLLPAGLASHEMLLQRTNYYLFSPS